MSIKFSRADCTDLQRQKIQICNVSTKPLRKSPAKTFRTRHFRRASKLA